jgi:hypothetical protein
VILIGGDPPVQPAGEQAPPAGKRGVILTGDGPPVLRGPDALIQTQFPEL